MVYATLKSLSGLELIDGEWDRSAYPPRAIYVATPEGDAAFERWLRQPVGRMREVRHEFMVKLYFAMKSDPDLAEQLVSEQIEACAAYGAELEREIVEFEPGSFDAIALTSKITAAHLTGQWLAQCRDQMRLAGGRTGS